MSKTNVGLVDWCRNHLGQGYVYGTYFSAIVSEYLLQQKAAQYPKKYTKDYLERSRRWIGKNAGDCVGLIKSYYWYDELSGKVVYRFQDLPDKSANGMMQAAQAMGGKTASQNLGITWGYLDNLPEIPGILVWRTGHIGVYIGNKRVIESRGVDYGAVNTEVNSRGWTNWCKCPYISYGEAKPEEENEMNPYTEPTKIYPAGQTFSGNDARWFIFELIRRGHNLISNSDQAGKNTWEAIYKEQEKAGLYRGDAGPKTREWLKRRTPEIITPAPIPVPTPIEQLELAALREEVERLKKSNEALIMERDALNRKITKAIAELLTN